MKPQMAVGAIALAFGMLALDRASVDGVTNWDWLYAGGPQGARSLLLAVAGSMISVTATAFSITMYNRV